MNHLPPVHIAGTELGPLRHVCGFFNSLDEEYNVLLPFIEEGINSGQKAVHCVNPSTYAEHEKRLVHAGINVREAERVGQLEILPWEDAYLRGGRFDPDAMLMLIEDSLIRSRDEGYSLSRLVGQMDWAAEDRPGVDALIDYEIKLNYIVPKYNDVVVCAYDLAEFSAGVIIDVLRTHPMVVIGRVLQYNPFYVPPDEFVKELCSRRNKAA